jgi:hypothetical protein
MAELVPLPTKSAIINVRTKSRRLDVREPFIMTKT